MKKREGVTPAERRRRAELRLRERKHASGGAKAPSLEEAVAALNELEVHQLELEMQTEELLQAQGELDEALERYTQLYDAAPVGYATLNAEGDVQKVNLTGARMLGARRAEVVDRRLAAFIAAGDRPAFAAALARALLTRVEAECELSLEGAGADASIVQMVLSGTSADSCGVIIVDITARRRAEEKLRLAQTMDAMGRLASGLAHDFNNALAIILTHASLALDAVGPSSASYADLAEVKAAAERAACVTRRLLAFSRRQQPHRGTCCDVNRVVGDLATALRALLGERVKLVFALGAERAFANIAADELERLVTNLVCNARDAMPSGGTVALATANRAPHSAEGEDPGGECLVLTVADDGTGMTPETAARVFEPLFTTKDEGGTGLGLAVVYGIVQEAGGEISVRSTLGQGTTFEVCLPAAAKGASTAVPADRATPEGRPPSREGAAETIMVVDDEAALRRAFARVLKSAGYVVLTAESGEAALELAAQHEGQLHLVVTDVSMPGMSGTELGRRLKEARPDAKVLYMSGRAAQIAANTRPLLAKPCSLEALTAKVREVLDRGPTPDAVA